MTKLTRVFLAAAGLLLAGQLFAASNPPAAAPATFQPVGPMLVNRTYPTLTLLPDGSVLVAGGVLLDSIEIDDPATGQAAITGHLSGPRSSAAGVALADGRTLAAGGFIARGTKLAATADAERIDPVTGQASPAAAMTGPRAAAAAILLGDGRALFISGSAGLGAALRFSAEVYLP